MTSASSTIPRPEAILFDWDYTLVDNFGAIHCAMNLTLESFGMPAWTLEETVARAKRSLRDNFPLVFGDQWTEARDIFYESFARTHLNTLRALPGAQSMLEQARELGLYLGVVSNKNGLYLRREANHLGWEGLFSRIIGATDAERDKPALDPVVMALEESSVTIGQSVWFVGDTEIDLECAITAGCTGVLIRKKPPEKGEFDDYPPACYVNDCDGLSDLINGFF
ncbi:MAG: HAD family hydrolase [Rhodospirillales bacterium]|nr:HAD family hydrolase [Rhodospirillales bacterium]